MVVCCTITHQKRHINFLKQERERETKRVIIEKFFAHKDECVTRIYIFSSERATKGPRAQLDVNRRLLRLNFLPRKMMDSFFYFFFIKKASLWQWWKKKVGQLAFVSIYITGPSLNIKTDMLNATTTAAADADISRVSRANIKIFIVLVREWEPFSLLFRFAFFFILLFLSVRRDRLRFVTVYPQYFPDRNPRGARARYQEHVYYTAILTGEYTATAHLFPIVRRLKRARARSSSRRARFIPFVCALSVYMYVYSLSLSFPLHVLFFIVIIYSSLNDWDRERKG